MNGGDEVRERERERQRMRVKERQADKQADRKTDRQTKGLAVKEVNRSIGERLFFLIRIVY